MRHSQLVQMIYWNAAYEPTIHNDFASIYVSINN